MNAGMGIIHSERPTSDIHQIGGTQEIIQLWINTPAKYKMDQPTYFPVAADDVPLQQLDDGKVQLRVFSGAAVGLEGPIKSQTEVSAATLGIEKGGKISIPTNVNHNAFLYLLDGKIRVEGFGQVDALHLVHFENDGDAIALEAIENTRVLYLSGLPLNEKVVSHGPFVMNSQTEIMEAMRDYQMGKMGVLIE